MTFQLFVGLLYDRMSYHLYHSPNLAIDHQTWDALYLLHQNHLLWHLNKM